MTRRRQSCRWLPEHLPDSFVQRAQAEGWRSRALFKRAEADKKAHLLRRGQEVLNLGAAPGAWRQYAGSKCLAELALGMAGKVLKPGCGALIKLLQGAGFQELTAAARRQFRTARLLKPTLSRARSAGIYLLASGLRLV